MNKNSSPPPMINVHIGHGDNAKSVEKTAEALVKVLGAISRNRIDREVAIAAIVELGKVTGLHGATISDCNFQVGADK